MDALHRTVYLAGLLALWAERDVLLARRVEGGKDHPGVPLTAAEKQAILVWRHVEARVLPEPELGRARDILREWKI